MTGGQQPDAGAATDPAGPTGTLATWLAGLRLDDVPGPVQERAKHLLLDGFGCAAIGAQLPWSRTAVEAVSALEPTGPAPVIGWGRSLAAPAAAVLNSTFIQGFELDDFHPVAPLHSASLLIPSLLSSAALTGGMTGARFLLGTIAGFEVGPRVGRALHGTQMLTRGWHSGSVFGTLAAAGAVSVALGSPADVVEDALGLGATQSGGLMAAQYEAMSKRMHHGFAARAGLYGAHLAAAGYTGIKRVLEREYGGYLAVFGEGHEPNPRAATAGLGTVWETQSIVVKSYAAMGGLQGVVGAIRALVAQEPVDPGQIEHVEVGVSEAVYHHGWWRPERPLTPIGAQMNIGYVAAVTLLDGTALPDQFRTARLDADDVWALVDRTSAHVDPDLDTDLALRFATRVTLTMADGSTRSLTLAAPHGGPGDPVTDAEVVGKFRAITARVMPEPRSRQIERLVLGLDHLDDLGELIELVAQPVKGALD